jgi:hypothetical protein
MLRINDVCIVPYKYSTGQERKIVVRVTEIISEKCFTAEIRHIGETDWTERFFKTDEIIESYRHGKSCPCRLCSYAYDEDVGLWSNSHRKIMQQEIEKFKLGGGIDESVFDSKNDKGSNPLFVFIAIAFCSSWFLMVWAIFGVLL